MSAGDVCAAAVRRLWVTLDELDEIGFSLDPRDLAHNLRVLGDLVERVWVVTTEPPPGEPGDVEAAATRWRDTSRRCQGHADDLGRLDVHAVWRGTAAVACVGTIHRLTGRFEDAAALSLRASYALDDHAERLAQARRRHGEVGDHLRAAARRLGPCPPWEIPDMIRDVVAELREAIRAGIDAYRTAGESAAACERTLFTVVDGMPFPDAAVPGLSAFDLMNLGGGGAGTRPLVGDVAERAAARYEALGEGAREVVDGLLADTPSDEHRAWILAALASGASLETLANFADRIGEVPAGRGLARLLDPGSVVLPQQSSTTCGSASLTVARLLADPVAALRVLDGYDATTGRTDGGTTAERFAAEELAVKARTNDVVGERDLVLPWPDGLGTSPWGAAEEMNRLPGHDGYGLDLIRSGSPDDRQAAYDDVVRAVRDGRPVPLFVGDDLSPRHVVLVVGASDGHLEVYEPGDGDVVRLDERTFVAGDVSALGGWERPWAAVIP